jgi:alkylation response protein AidB-like acyl-CoA dehydrogenase
VRPAPSSRKAELPDRARGIDAHRSGNGYGIVALEKEAIAVLGMTPEVRELRGRVRAFMDEHIYPNEPVFDREDEDADALVKDLRARVKAAGLWAPHIGPEAGGTGRGFLPYVFLNELIGRSVWAPLVFGCQAPDAGNAEILNLFGTPEQRERWLRPLVAGDVRSFFSMTEPEVSGSDPTALRTTAVRDGDEWVIDGHKWFSSGAEGAAFAIVMAVTDPQAPPHRRMSQIIVPAGAPGVEIVRAIPVMGHRGRGWSTHCEVRYRGVRVPVANTIGEPGDGFRIAQKRLGPGRIHHVMRWLGQMQRAFELMCAYALRREVFGGPLAGKQTLQNWVADSAAEIQACRLLTLDARVLNDVVDRALQAHGALGLTDQTPLARMYADARAARFYDGPDEVHRMVVSRRILKAFEAGEGWDFAAGGPAPAG